MKARKIKMTKTIKSVVSDGLCTGCGTCAGLCPQSAIMMVINWENGIYLPLLDEDKCNQCGICYKVCPGHSVDFDELNNSIFGKIPEDLYLGNYENCYVGHATDKEIRYNSSSGGIITSLLVYALQSGKIEGAIVVKASQDDPLKAESCLATNVDGVIAASGSKYCPVPVGNILQQVRESTKKWAFVGLPCHVQGLRKAQREIESLKKRIPFVIGLFCSRVPSIEGVKFMLRRFGVDPVTLKRLRYRKGGWPGSVEIEKNSGEILRLGSLPAVWSNFFGVDFFTPSRCLLCSDPLSGLADVSCGDPWLPDYRDEKRGISCIIARSQTGTHLLFDAAQKGRIKLDEISPERVIVSQASGVRMKRQNLNARFWFARKIFRYSVPVYSDAKVSRLKPLRGAYLFGWLPYLSRYMGRSSLLRNIWWKLPPCVRKIYGIVFHQFV